MHRNIIGEARTERPPTGAVLRNSNRCFDQAAASAFRFLRQPSRPNAPRPQAKSGSAAGSGVASIGVIVPVNVPVPSNVN